MRDRTKQGPQLNIRAKEQNNSNNTVKEQQNKTRATTQTYLLTAN